MRLLCWSKLFTEVDVFRLAWQQCGTSWERADREPAAATSTWSSETPAITAKEQTPQRGIRDGLCLIYPLKSPPMIQRQFFFVQAKESSAFIWKMANDSPAKSLVDIDLASLRVSAAEPSLCFFSFLFFLAAQLAFISRCSIKHTSLARASISKFEPALQCRFLLELKYWKWPLSHSEVLPVSGFPLFEMHLAWGATAGSHWTMLFIKEF